ncbi:MAG: cell division protein FtsQ/DivIB [Pseudomonadota bacterium]
MSRTAKTKRGPAGKRKTAKRKSSTRVHARRDTGRVRRNTYDEREYAGIAFNRIVMISAAGICMVALVIGGVLWSGGYVGGAANVVNEKAAGVARDVGFKVKKITLRGAHDTAHADVLDAVGPIVGESILHVDLDGARARVEELGWVRVAAVTRLLPDTINVSVRERRPSAVWQHDGVLALIDASGAVIQTISGDAYSQLPMVVGAGAPEAASGVLKALTDHPAISERIHALIRIGERRWDLKLRNGLIIKLPDSARPTVQAAAINELSQLHDAQGILDQEIEYIDLLDPDRVLMRRRGQTALIDR